MLPSLQFRLSIFSRKGWWNCEQSFTEHSCPQFPTSVPPAHLTWAIAQHNRTNDCKKKPGNGACKRRIISGLKGSSIIRSLILMICYFLTYLSRMSYALIQTCFLNCRSCFIWTMKNVGGISFYLKACRMNPSPCYNQILEWWNAQILGPSIVWNNFYTPVLFPFINIYVRLHFLMICCLQAHVVNVTTLCYRHLPSFRGGMTDEQDIDQTTV